MNMKFLSRINYYWGVFRVRFIISRIDKQKIPKGINEIRLFVTARNEALRLPFFLKYYFEMGVDRIFLIDNASTDNTVEIALSKPNVHVFKIDESFKNQWNWVEFFLRKYGRKRWCMVVDVDELFSYPYAEVVPLKILIDYMEMSKHNAIRSFLLDIYSNNPVRETGYVAGENPITCCSYFDKDFSVTKVPSFDKKRWKNFEAEIYFGGMRERVFSSVMDRPWIFYLSKISLFKNVGKIYLTGGMHTVNSARITDIRGVVFHTKYMQDFIMKAQIEAGRSEHWAVNALDYKIYDKACESDVNISFHHEKSIKYKNTRQLLKIGMMKTSFAYNNYISTYRFDFNKLFDTKE
ncbi:MAG: glycosyltransferase family 2 protein [Prolixibacteraceae bacterium]|nr:glycosyltransferase family 2 protein [Prolixibacteraceae bacterium]